MMLRSLLFCLYVFSFFAVGCGPTAAPLPINQREEPGSIGQLKKDLQGIAEHGTGDSALQPVLDGIKALDKSNPLQAELAPLAQKLASATTPEKRKEIAASMMEKVNAVTP